MLRGRYRVEWTCDAPYPSYSRRTSIDFAFSDFGSEFEAKALAEACRSLPESKVIRFIEEERVV